MIRRFEKPDENVIFNDVDLPPLINEAEARRELAATAVRGNVYGWKGGGRLVAPSGVFSKSTASRSSVDYVTLTGPNHTYRAYRTGQVVPQNGAPPARENPYLGSYLLSNRWPYAAGTNVSVSSAQSESQTATAVPYYSASPTVPVSLDMNLKALRSDTSIRIVGAAVGAATIGASLTIPDGSGGRVKWAENTTSVSGTGWSVYDIALGGAERLGHGNGPIKLKIDPGGASQLVRPIAFRSHEAFAGGVLPLPDGTGFVVASDGRGKDDAGRPLHISGLVSFRADLARGLVTYVTKFATGAKERSIYAGRDRSRTHQIERTFASRVWAAPASPDTKRALLSRLVLS